ncbi:MAG: M48 family metalloprotease [Candidatus Omnitrophica bacterium]|nr:M48 family metalloprotease [Candidatus Omnitrophota bacterium]
MLSLQLRMALLLAALFGILYAVVVMVGTAMGVNNFGFYLVISLGMMLVQYLIGPKIVEWSMRIRYLKREDAPDLFAMVEELSERAGIPVPRVCVSDMQVPNAFAFGRGLSDGRVCVTRGIMQLLDREELRAVLGHELSHIKNRDVLTITLLSVIPMIMYRIAWQLMFYGSGRRDSRDSGGGVLIGIVAFLFYFLTNLLVLYASRIREYFADKGSVELGNRPEALASALYKLVYGSARLPKETLRESEGLKAFFLNDPSQAAQEFNDLKQLDLDHSGTIDSVELARLRQARVKVRGTDRMMELLSTHPNMLKRIQHLSELAG